VGPPCWLAGVVPSPCRPCASGARTCQALPPARSAVPAPGHHCPGPSPASHLGPVACPRPFAPLPAPVLLSPQGPNDYWVANEQTSLAGEKLGTMPGQRRSNFPTYQDLIYPTLRAVASLGGSAQAREITARVLKDIGATDEQIAITYPNRTKSVLIDRLEWARSYAKLGGALDSPRRGLFVLTTLGKETLALPEADAIKAVKEVDRQVRASRAKTRPASSGDVAPSDDDIDAEDSGWTDVLLGRLHKLSSEGFEEFVMYLLRTYGLELTRVGGTGDQGIDGIGIAPISPVLSSRVAVQAKRYDPTSTISRDVVALFQRDAAAAGAERAVLVTLGRFTEAARQASTTTTPTVDLIDGQKLCELVREKEVGLRIVPQVQEAWFDRFDSQG